MTINPDKRIKINKNPYVVDFQKEFTEVSKKTTLSQLARCSVVIR